MHPPISESSEQSGEVPEGVDGTMIDDRQPNVSPAGAAVTPRDEIVDEVATIELNHNVRSEGLPLSNGQSDKVVAEDSVQIVPPVSDGVPSIDESGQSTVDAFLEAQSRMSITSFSEEEQVKGKAETNDGLTPALSGEHDTTPDLNGTATTITESLEESSGPTPGTGLIVTTTAEQQPTDAGAPTTDLSSSSEPSPAKNRRKEDSKCKCRCDPDCDCDCTCSDPSHCYCRHEKCEKSCGRHKGRNLIVSIDGTSNQFGKNNTNVVELHSRIVTGDGMQLKCYLSGIGTALPPSPLMLSYWKVKFGNWIDLAIAWRFARIIQEAWFSRGAYQVRTLAGMIHTLGLLEAGNKTMIPYAYDLYTMAGGDCYVLFFPNSECLTRVAGTDHNKIVNNFKRSFSYEDVRVHFVGAWDTVSSIGVLRQKPLPLSNTTSHVCFFRHALALDERRVKFIPEYLKLDADTSDLEETKFQAPIDKRDVGLKGSKSHTAVEKKDDSQCQDDDTLRIGAEPQPTVTETTHAEGMRQDDDNERTGAEQQPRVSETTHAEGILKSKEVWFAGTHSDIGGGYRRNITLDNAGIPLLWMENEASRTGLILRAREEGIDWKWDALASEQPTESLTPFPWYLFEDLPIASWEHLHDNVQELRWTFHESCTWIWLSKLVQDSHVLRLDFIPNVLEFSYCNWLKEPFTKFHLSGDFPSISIQNGVMSGKLTRAAIWLCIFFCMLFARIIMGETGCVAIWLLRFDLYIVLAPYFLPGMGFTLMPHQGRGRTIQKGQLIHASVAFKNKYTPLASLRDFDWSQLTGKGRVKGGMIVDISWSESPELRGRLEMDLFDASLVKETINHFLETSFQAAEKRQLLHRLSFIARSRDGAETVAQHTGSLIQILARSIIQSSDNTLSVLDLARGEGPAREQDSAGYLGALSAECLAHVVRNAQNMEQHFQSLKNVIEPAAAQLQNYLDSKSVDSDSRGYADLLLCILAASGACKDMSQTISSQKGLARNLAVLLRDEVLSTSAARALSAALNEIPDMTESEDPDWKPDACKALLEMLQDAAMNRDSRNAAFQCLSILEQSDHLLKHLVQCLDQPRSEVKRRFFFILSLGTALDGRRTALQDAIQEIGLLTQLLQIVHDTDEHICVRLMASDMLATLLSNGRLYHCNVIDIAILCEMLFSPQVPDPNKLSKKAALHQCDATESDGVAMYIFRENAEKIVYLLKTIGSNAGKAHTIRWLVSCLKYIDDDVLKEIRKLEATRGLASQLFELIQASQGRLLMEQTLAHSLYGCVLDLALSKSQAPGVRLSAFDALYEWSRSISSELLVKSATVQKLVDLISSPASEEWPSIKDACLSCNGLKDSLAQNWPISSYHPANLAMEILLVLSRDDDLREAITEGKPFAAIISVLSDRHGRYAPAIRKSAAYFVEYMADHERACKEMLESDIIVPLLDLHEEFVKEGTYYQYTRDALGALKGSGKIFSELSSLSTVNPPITTADKWLENQSEDLRSRYERLKQDEYVYGW
ncbi:hypothetical protein D9758_009564 [Tetrapyrgos nigripes]|uniref:T6SS Phospholipase effector Tle1-like catalytic domain-containing protein n=1 Tax=Tetrapyrgos nigripes TaxID=182062 RepID=A0A8H5GCU1_9AGAR|nr:hypothetical protein D9758_009564 [Tetrapyrgos nigripes]